MLNRCLIRLLVGGVLLLAVVPTGMGQDAAAGSPGADTTPPTLRWETVGDIKILRVWQITGRDSFPQISLLFIPSDALQKFTHNPTEFRKFVNDQKVFSKPVLTVGPAVTLSAVDETGDSDGYYVTAVHTTHSRMTVSALPANPNLKPLSQN